MKTGSLFASALLAGALVAAGPASAQTAGDTGTTAGAAGMQQQTGAAGMEHAGAQGMSQDKIRSLQQALNDAGHDIAVDGIWGPQTQNALREYQQAQGMPATGEPDDETLASLDVQDDAMGQDGMMGQDGALGATDQPAMGQPGMETQPGTGAAGTAQ